MSLPLTVVLALTSATSRSGPVGLIRSHLESVRFCARVCCTKSTGMPFLLASFLIFFFLSLLCRASRQFSTKTALGNCGILLPLGNTTPSTLRHCSTNSWYLSRLRSWASSIRSSCGTVSSINSTVFSVCDHIMMSGRTLVVAICYGKLICLLTSARICQLLLVAMMPSVAVFTCFPRFPSVSLITLMNWGPFPSLAPNFLRALTRPTARTSSTWLCLFVYVPSARAFSRFYFPEFVPWYIFFRSNRLLS